MPKERQVCSNVKRSEFSLYNVHLNCYRFFEVSLVLGGLFCFSLDPVHCSTKLGWSSSLLLQTEVALIGDYSREHTDYRYVLYMTPVQKTQTIPSTSHFSIGIHTNYGQCTSNMKMIKCCETQDTYIYTSK